MAPNHRIENTWKYSTLTENGDVGLHVIRHIISMETLGGYYHYYSLLLKSIYAIPLFMFSVDTL